MAPRRWRVALCAKWREIPLSIHPRQNYPSDKSSSSRAHGRSPARGGSDRGEARVGDTGDMQGVPPDAVMPPGAMSEPDIQVEQDEMPPGSMEPEEVEA